MTLEDKRLKAVEKFLSSVEVQRLESDSRNILEDLSYAQVGNKKIFTKRPNMNIFRKRFFKKQK